MQPSRRCSTQYASIIPSGFPSFESVRIRASTLSKPASFMTRTEQPQAVFPSLRFKCNGEIKRIWYIGRMSDNLVSATTLPMPPAFQLFRKISRESMYTQNQTTESVDITREAVLSRQVQLLSISLNKPLTYQKDDIFGSRRVNPMKQVDLLHVPQLGPTVYYIDSNNFSQTPVDSSYQQYADYPLVAIETSKLYDQCIL